MVIRNAGVVRMTRRAVVMAVHMAMLQGRLRAALPVCGQAAEETQLDQQAENDDAGVTHEDARGNNNC